MSKLFHDILVLRRRAMGMTAEEAAAEGKINQVALEDLRQIFGEALSPAWGGYSVPHLGMVKMQGSAGPASLRGPAWGPIASFPFHTAAALKVWDQVKKIAPKMSDANPDMIVRAALDDCGVGGMDVTPEDWRLLGMAIRWLQTTAKPNRSGPK